MKNYRKIHGRDQLKYQTIVIFNKGKPRKEKSEKIMRARSARMKRQHCFHVRRFFMVLVRYKHGVVSVDMCAFFKPRMFSSSNFQTFLLKISGKVDYYFYLH